MSRERPHQQAAPLQATELTRRVRQVELAISWVLRIGVLVSVMVIAAGLLLMFLHHPLQTRLLDDGSNYHAQVQPGAHFPHDLTQLRAALAAGHGRGVIVLGVLLLILTPVLRVAVSVLSFVYERDPPMVLVTLFVLLVLVLSFVLA
ncbi:DUF1634 domain-containing protein [Metallibacterium sp.]|jgi:uncharacterized membrane protein|uniref:DUF1634 domain-containing protein n=1 Tax=Metallibacterium sp. TaxID=2940281 RepID=UPI00261869BF|nr:DUF1634 domain-containing protein [Metallibacterium sp.]